MKLLPTPNALMARVGVIRSSVAYHQSDAILNHLSEPVIAYGVGFGGFVCVIKIHGDFLRGYSYTVKHPYCSWPDAGFNVMEVDKVVEEINMNELFSDTGFNKEAFEKGKLKPDYGFERLVLGSFISRTRNHHTNFKQGGVPKWGDWTEYQFRLVRLKNGKIRAEVLYSWNSGRFIREDPKSFLSWWEREEGIIPTTNPYRDKAECRKLDVDMPADVIDELKSQIIIQDI